MTLSYNDSTINIVVVIIIIIIIMNEGYGYSSGTYVSCICSAASVSVVFEWTIRTVAHLVQLSASPSFRAPDGDFVTMYTSTIVKQQS